MKKKLISFLAITVIAFSFTACGDNETENSTQNNGSVTLELFSTKGENLSTLETLAQKYNSQNENATIEVYAPADAGTVLKTKMATNDMPDILSMGGNQDYTEVQSAGMLMDLSDKEYVSNIQPAYMQMLYDVNKDKEEKAYGIPYATNASGVLYNVDIFEENNIEVPTTWDEFINVLETLKSSDIQPLLLTYKDAWTCLCPWNSMAPDLQPDNFTDMRFANETTFVGTHEEIAQKYLDLLPYGQSDFMGTGYDDGNKAFANGDAAMMINGSWTINQFKNANPDFNVDMFAFPASNDTTKNYVTSGVDVLLAISNQATNIDEAENFVKFMLEPENNKLYIDEQFAFSPMEGVVQEDVSVKGVMEDIQNGKVANFPDHYYPAGFDLAAILSEFSLNYVNGMEDSQNIEQFLQQCDEKYDIANVN